MTACQHVTRLHEIRLPGDALQLGVFASEYDVLDPGNAPTAWLKLLKPVNQLGQISRNRSVSTGAGFSACV
jgi:hypothetical protein